MKAYFCLYIGLTYQNVVFAFSTSLGPVGLDTSGPTVISMNGGNKKTKGIVNSHAQSKTNGYELESNVIKPTWEKRTDRLYDSNKPLISNNLDSHIGTEIKGTNHGQSERSDNDLDIVINIGEPRQPGSIFFNPHWTSQVKNDNNGFIYQPDINSYHNQPGNNGFKNHPGQSGIYAASKGNFVQIGKGDSQLWKPQYVGNRGPNKHQGHTSKGYKQSHNFQIGKSFYSLSRDTLNSTHPRGKKKVLYKLRNSPYNSIHRFKSSTQNPGRSGIFSVSNKKWNQNSSQKEKSGSVVKSNVPIKGTYHKFYRVHSKQHGKPNPLRNRIIYSKREGPIKTQQGNQKITNWLPNTLKSAMNSSSFEEDNGNDADKPSEAKIRVHPYRHKGSTSITDSRINENDNEGTPTGQFWVGNTNSPYVGNVNPVRHSLNRIHLGDYLLNRDQRLDKNTSGTITYKRVRAPKGHSWNQRDLEYSGNLIHPARHSLNPIILAGKGLNTLYPEMLNTDHPGGRNTNHPDEQSNGNSGNQNLNVERNIHYPDITGMKNVHPKDLLHYLRRHKVLDKPTAGVDAVPNATKITTPVINFKEAAKWSGILFRTGSPKNGTRSRFMSFPLGTSSILRDDDGPVKYKFHFGGILWWK